ncbi:branched-chain amino acid ABC transporter permease [Gemmatimonadota bacterium]
MTGLFVHIGIMLLILAVLLAGQQILFFDCGLLCLGTAAFYCIGAYVSTILCVSFDMPVSIAIICAAGVSIAIALLVGYPLLKYLHGDYFALATLAFNQTVYVLIRSLAPGGVSGIGGIPPFVPRDWGSIGSIFVHTVLMGAAFAAVVIIRRRRLGLLIRAIRLDENLAQATGFRTTYVKLQVFTFAALLAGIAGSLQAHYIGAVSPEMSSIQTTVLLLCGVILGGRQRVSGTLLGAAVIVSVREMLQMLFSSGMGSQWQVFSITQLAYGLIIVSVSLIFFRRSKASALVRERW